MNRLMLCLAVLAALASPRASATPPNDPADLPRYTLKQGSAEPAPLRSSRYSIRARFAATDRAGDLHEGANFTLLGKFAKGGESCSASALFSNGFE